MLTKGIIWQQELIFFYISEHAVWPVKHRGFHKGEGPTANGEGITRFHNPEIH